MAGPEARLRTRIVKALNTYSGHFFVILQTQYGRTGVSDIIGVYQGKFFALEVKRPGKLHTLTANQARFISKVQKCGGRAAVVTSVEDAMNFVFGDIP